MTRTATAMLLTTIAFGLAGCDDDPLDTNEEFGATLTAEGSVESAATGTAAFVLDDGVVSYTINVEDITAVTGAHIHGPAGPGQGAGVIVGLFAGPDGGTGDVDGLLVANSFTEADISAVSLDSLLVLMRNGQSYVNVHTAANPGGEIRGQITAQ